MEFYQISLLHDKNVTLDDVISMVELVKFSFKKIISLGDIPCELFLVRVYRYPIRPTFRTMIGKKKGDCRFFICIAR
jgi:hypothetical protein